MPFSFQTGWKRNNIQHFQGGKCFEYAYYYQADIKISFINLEKNEKLCKILHFVVSLYICFMINAIEVL